MRPTLKMVEGALIHAKREADHLRSSRDKWMLRTESLLEAGNSMAMRLQDLEPDHPSIEMWIRFASGQKTIDTGKPVSE